MSEACRGSLAVVTIPAIGAGGDANGTVFDFLPEVHCTCEGVID